MLNKVLKLAIIWLCLMLFVVSNVVCQMLFGFTLLEAAEERGISTYHAQNYAGIIYMSLECKIRDCPRIQGQLAPTYRAMLSGL